MKIKVIRDNRGDVRDERDKKLRLTGIDAQIALCLKLHEEAGEIANHLKDVFEYADLLEVLYELGNRNGFSKRQIERARKQKRKKLGGFNKCILLVTTNHDNDK